jgi:hypothetical protein
MKTRTIILTLASAFVVASLFYSDPNGGALTLMLLQQLSTPVLAVWFAFLSRKALMDYINLEELMLKAKESSIGAAIVFLGTCLVFFGLLGLFGSQLAHAQVPAQAVQYLPIVKSEQTAIWVDHPKATYLQVSLNTSPAYPSLIQSVGIPKVD